MGSLGEILLTSIEEIYKNFLRKKVESGKRRPGLHVSDLVSDCLRKSWYKMGEVEKKIDDESVTAFYYGTAIHSSFDGMFDVMEYPMYVDPFEEKQLDEDYIPEGEDVFKCVSGSLDAIVNGDTILDFKTCSKLPNEASGQYIRQINFYSYMYYLHTGIHIKKGAILYLEKSSGFKNHRIITFNLNPLEINRGLMTTAMNLIKNNEPPEKVPTPLCTACPYKETCKPTGYYNYIEKKYIFK